MERQGLTHDQLVRLAEAGGKKVSRETISNILNQHNDPSGEILSKLAAVLGVAAPRVEKILVLGGQATSPLASIRLAQATLEEAARMLGAATPNDPVTAKTVALVQEEARLIGRGKRGAQGRGKSAG